jgi:8-oxo-dGTP pyrophosphatase MutT (NUDIX family)
MTDIEKLIESLQQHAILFPSEKDSCKQTVSWLQKYSDFAFVKENLNGHITGSMMITNSKRNKVLLMLHKKFQRWQQFGGHCDGEKNTRNVAIREFQEESGISLLPEIV